VQNISSLKTSLNRSKKGSSALLAGRKHKMRNGLNCQYIRDTFIIAGALVTQVEPSASQFAHYRYDLSVGVAETR
jgi:hypothetical protein